MIELPDDELDKLFRKSSEELDPQFDPEDWNSLKKRLDEHDGRTAGAWIRKWWPLGLLLLLIPAGIASYRWASGPESEKAQIVKQPVEVPGSKATNEPKVAAPANEVLEEEEDNVASAGQDIQESSIETNELTAKAEKVEPANNKTVKPATKTGITDPEKAAKPKSIAYDENLKYRKGSSKSLPRSQSKAGGVYLEPNRSKTGGGDGALILSGNKKLISDSKGTFASELGARKAIGPDRVEGKNDRVEAGNEPNVVLNRNNSISEGVTDHEEQKILISASMLDGKSLTWKNNLPYPGVVVRIVPADSTLPEKSYKSESKEDAIIASPKWAIRLGYSPDLTTVGFKNFTKPGAAFSLLGEYGISKRWYVQAGIVRSVKDYYAKAGDYELKKYVTDINTPYGVDGTCTMFEVPIGVRFDIAQKPHSRWFAGTGFSSYYAQKEKYTYYYKDYVHMQKPGWQGKTGWFFLSHLNASVGYERTITRKLSILAEPYIRIPLKGVGYGKVNLLTTGMWISLRYTPVFH